MLKIEDVKVDDAVECIDIAEFSKIWRKSRGYDINKMENTSILEIDPYYFRLKGKFLIGNMGFDEIRASLDCLKYFKKKEQSQYTFDDLVDVAVQARKDKLIGSINICENYIAFEHGNHAIWYGANRYQDGIDFIQSLYKETFVIESEEDIERLKNGAKVTLKNGEAIYFSNIDDGDYWFDFDHVDCQKFPFLALKGATVEQERGRDD